MINVAIVKIGGTGTAAPQMERRRFAIELTPKEIIAEIFKDKDKDKDSSNTCSNESSASSCLLFCGKMIDDNMKLSDVDGLKVNHTVYMMRRPCVYPRPCRPETTLNIDKLATCRRLMPQVNNSQPDRVKFKALLKQADLWKHLEKRVPLLKYDKEACDILGDYALTSAFLHAEHEEFLKAHPLLVDAVYELLVEISPLRSSGSSELAANDELGNAFERDNESSIANAGGGGGGGGGGSGVSLINEIRPPAVTSQMLQEAMEQVFRSMTSDVSSSALPLASFIGQEQSTISGGTTGNSGMNERSAVITTSDGTREGGSSSSAAAASSVVHTTTFDAEMAQLFEFGFTDTQQNARVLEETGGDVQQALELLIALRESAAAAASSSSSPSTSA